MKEIMQKKTQSASVYFEKDDSNNMKEKQVKKAKKD